MSEWRRAGIASHATRPSVRDLPSALFLQWPGEWLTKAIDACANQRGGPRSLPSPLTLIRRLNPNCLGRLIAFVSSSCRQLSLPFTSEIFALVGLQRVSGKNS